MSRASRTNAKPSWRRLVGSGMPFFAFQPLATPARYIATALILLFVVGNFVLADVGEMTGWRFVAYALVWMVAALAPWFPPAVAVAMIPAGTLGLIAGLSTNATLAFILVAAFVSLACSLRLIVAYTAAYVIWQFATIPLENREFDAGMFSVLLVFLATTLIGLGFRAARNREQSLNAQIADQEHLRREAAARERARIAAELHDVVAHDLTIISMHAHALRLGPDEASRADSERVIGESAKRALIDLRHLLDVLYGPERMTVDASRDTLATTLGAIENELTAASIPVHLEIDETEPIPRSIDLSLTRVAREAVTNIVKHSPTTAGVRIALATAGGAATLTISNSPERGSQRMRLPSSGYGLIGMRERVEGVGGTFHAGPDQHGWTVRATIPLD
ncbi:sensor histidine kinase [Microbacterium sp.]|uniref:sensor histidine kinase n=1 Tax=Microbacterium sp. TaxID=51671 RepID=UPI003A8A0AA3